MLGPIASNITVVGLDADRTILSGSGVVYGILVSNNSGGEVVVTCRNVADDKEWLVMHVADNRSERWEVPCLVSGGYVIESVSSASVVATVAHTNPQGSA